MAPPTWTTRLAAMLRVELAVLHAEQQAEAFDDGFGQLAMAAIMAVPAGPRRDLEIATWAARFDGRYLAVPIQPDTSDDELRAMQDLDRAIVARLRGAA